MGNATFISIVAAVIVTALPAPAAAAKQAIELAPADKWRVHYADDSCRMSRLMGQGDDAIGAIFDRFVTGDHFRLSLVGKPLKRFGNRGAVSLQFGPNEAVQKQEFMGGTYGENLPALFINANMRVAVFTAEEEKQFSKMKPEESYKIPALDASRIAAITQLSFGPTSKLGTTLKFGSLKAPMAALNTCTDNLMRQWGIDVERHKKLVVPVVPVGSPGNWITSGDYPGGALFKGEQGIVNFRLSVDESGAATACHIQQSTRSKDFDALVCKAMMKRAKFSPAIDAEGKALASYYRNTVRFVMP